MAKKSTKHRKAKFPLVLNQTKWGNYELKMTEWTLEENSGIEMNPAHTTGRFDKSPKSCELLNSLQKPFKTGKYGIKYLTEILLEINLNSKSDIITIGITTNDKDSQLLVIKTEDGPTFVLAPRIDYDDDKPN